MKTVKGTSGKAGFTLLEIMIVVTIIGFLAGMGIPAFMKARSRAQTTRCIDNMNMMSGFKDAFAVENFLNAGDTLQFTDVSPYFKRGIPDCPAGGTYDLQPVGDEPTCTVAGGHIL